MTMKLTIIKVASLGILLGLLVLPARAELFNYVVRTSGLGWSNGYHAYDQCPPRKHLHQQFGAPGYGSPTQAQQTPYYFEQNNDVPETDLPPAPTTQPNAPALNPQLPNPQAQYKPRSRYFQAVEQELGTQQPQQMQARRPANAPPY
jgi:hypothetical protein